MANIFSFTTLLILASTFIVGACSPSGKSTDSSTGTGGGGGGSSPTYGMSCTGNNGQDLFSSKPIAYIANLSSVTGSSISAIQLGLSLNGYGNSTTSTTVTLDVYTCVTAGAALPTRVGTATLTMGMNGFSKPATFTFSSPISIPTSCASGTQAFGFKLSGFASDPVKAQIDSGAAATCPSVESTSTTQVNTGGARSWTMQITSNP